MKKIIKKALVPIGTVLVLAYIVVFIISETGYYQTIESKNKTLTEEAMENFEKDVIDGKDIVASNYLEKRPDYNNLITRVTLSIGNIIESIFNKIMKLILNEVENAIK